MPSTRRVAVRENWRKRARPSPQLETEPQDLRIVIGRVDMEQNAETNGCEDGPVSLAVSNHNDVAQSVSKTDKQMAKSLSTPEAKKSRPTTSNAKSNRARRSTPSSSSFTPTSNNTPTVANSTTSPPASERRATRNIPPPAAPSAAGATTPKPLTRTPTAAERKVIKNLPPLPVVSSNKKAVAHPLVLSPPSGVAPDTVALVPPVRLSKVSSSPLKKRKSSSSAKRQHHSDVDLEGRASKRVRLQHQPFQSPPPPTLIPAILRQQVIKTPEDKIVVFQKGEFLAVRNENGSFFVCRTAQNVYKSSKRFKIQWMSDKEPDIYIPDFYDQTDFECVLTNLRMKRVDKNKFALPSEERQRTLNILQRALNVENGMDISTLQVTTDGVDVSIVGKEDEEILRLQQETLKSEQKNKISQLRSRAANRAAKRAASRGRPKRPEPVAKVTRAAAVHENKSKTLAAKVKLRARETVKVKLKEQGERIIVSNKGSKPATKLKKIAERLHPNPNVTLFEKDPTFQTKLDIKYISSSAHSKLLIRAIHLKDMKMLQELIDDNQKICSLSTYRSVDVQLTPLMFAVLEENHKAIRALLTVHKKHYASPPETLLEYQSAGRSNPVMFGFSTKAVNACRGGKEGNNAFLKDISFSGTTYPEVNGKLIKEALRAGVSKATFDLLYADNKDESCTFSWNKDEVYRNIQFAVRNGHHKLAGQLVSEAVERGGYGFGNLHKEVLLNDRQPLSAFKSVSVTKKAQGSARITPLHCAAINPNPEYLTALLYSSSEYNLSDENGWRPIHYAAVCKSTGPLELLISRSISLEEAENDGNTALLVAALAGRAHNVDLILRHLIASEHNKKETAITVSLQDKQCVNAIDKGNKKSYTALHIAAEQGHPDVVRVLIRHKANVDKMTNAQHDKLTPLMLASQKGHLDVVKLLIEHSAQVEMKDKRQRTALTHAVINGHAHVTSYLLRLGANPNTTDSSGNTLVHYAAAYGWYFCMQLLFEAGASLNLPNDWKITPLSLAFLKGHMGLVDYLVEQPGIDINVDVDNDNGMTLVMQTVRSKINQSMLERIHFLVVKQKSDCSKVDFMGNNAFHHLVLTEVSEIELEEKARTEHDSLLQDITKLLLDHGCDPMARNKEGESPFNLAVKEGCLLLVKMFLGAGCNLTLDVSQSGDTILHYLVSHARSRKVEPMLQAILNAKCSNSDTTPHQLLCEMAKMYNKKGYTPLLQALDALERGNDEPLINFTKFLLDELGADVSAPVKNAEGKETTYALHLGAKCFGGNKVMEVLLEHKPPLNCFDDQGQTPLILAIRKENVDAIVALVKAGANVNLKTSDKDKISPLLLAAQSSKLCKLVKLFVNHKADVNDVDIKNKNTALHYVVSTRAPDVLDAGKTLLTAGADVNALNDKQRTPLHLSINASLSNSDSSYAIEECLLGFGALLDALDCRHRIPLHYAFVKIGKPFFKNHIDPMELVSLLTGSMQKETLEIADDFGQTVLHCAARRGASICAGHLCKIIGNTEAKDSDGNTALGLAVKYGHESCAVSLMIAGASCVAEVVTPIRKKPADAKQWMWSHARPPPPLPEKHTILQETLLRDWQAVLFLMLEQLDKLKGINIAVEAALRTAKYNIALKLIGRIKNSWLLYNDKQSMLHVLAREAPANHSPEVQTTVANFLIEKGVPVMRHDEHGCSVVTYAAVNRNFALANYFATKMSISVVAKIDPDKSLRTPLSALFWKLTSEDFSEDIKKWCLSLIGAGANVNVLTHYPIRLSPFPGVRCAPLDNLLHIEDPASPKYSPLLMAMYKANFPVIKLLLNNGADVNFPDSQLRTPLMHAVRLNDIKLVKLLLNFNYDPSKDKNPYSDVEPLTFQKTSPVNLSAQDVNGWTVLHYLVDPLPDYCYANIALLNFLAEMGAPLDTLDAAGETPLQMATRLHRKILVTPLQKLLKTPEDQKIKIELSLPVPPSDDVHWDQPLSSYVEDSKAFLDKLESVKMDTDDRTSLTPDSLSGFEVNGEILMDTEKDVPYDVVMTVVDMNYGTYGIYNFYKMQIIKHIGKDLFILFTCWGRVGDSGQCQKTPYSSQVEAVKEFCKVFRAKSGNNWDDVKNFQPQPKKYRLVELQKKKSKRLDVVKLNMKSDVASKLIPQKQKLMEDLMNVHTIQDTLTELGITAKFDALPFGSLTLETLQASEKILKDIGDVIIEKNNLRQNVKSQDKYSDLMQKIVKLSEEFYQLLPVYGYQCEKLCPLFNDHDIHSKLQLIHNLIHIGISSQLLLAATHKSAEIHPVDYVYRSLNCNLNLMNQDSQEAQMILQYIQNTDLSKRVDVRSIYSVYHPEQAERFKSSAPLPNHMLLWHGTRLSNMLAILSRGLQVAPLGVEVNGDMFGKGIYFADMFTKSQKYCLQPYSSETKCILLCEVALGNVKEIDSDSGAVIDSTDKLDSVKAVGRKQPDPAKSVFWKGMTVPLGPPINAIERNTSQSYHYLNFNEYIVYDSSQVFVRYLVQFSDNGIH